MAKINNGPNHNPALEKFVAKTTPNALLNYHYVVPMPRALLPSRIIEWCKANCEHGWLIQLPRMGMASWRNTVLLFEDDKEMAAFRDQYCFDQRYHKRPHEGDWLDATDRNE